jgi:hypothetical protein
MHRARTHPPRDEGYPDRDVVRIPDRPAPYEALLLISGFFVHRLMDAVQHIIEGLGKNPISGSELNKNRHVHR